MDKDKLKEYIDLCAPSFLIKMKTTTDKSYFFKAHPSGTDKDPAYKDGIFRFTIANIDHVGDEDTHHYREINLNNEFDDLESLKAVIIPEHKDMYKDIETDGMSVDCGKDNCGGDALKKEDVVPNVPQGKKRESSLPTKTIDLGQEGKDPLIKTQEQAVAIHGERVEQGKKKLEVAPITHQDTGEGGFEELSDDEEPVEQEGGRKKKKKRRKKRSRSKKRRNKRKNRTKKN